jgi:SAM-dependent methyltransferase
VAYEHGLAEATRHPAGAFDMVALQFVIHECPQAATRAFVAEAARLLAPGGSLVVVDNDPRSATIQNLPAPIFTLMKSTEPWSDEYYSLDLARRFFLLRFARPRPRRCRPTDRRTQRRRSRELQRPPPLLSACIRLALTRRRRGPSFIGAARRRRSCGRRALRPSARRRRTTATAPSWA